ATVRERVEAPPAPSRSRFTGPLSIFLLLFRFSHFRFTSWRGVEAAGLVRQREEQVRVGDGADIQERPRQPLAGLLDAQLPLRDGEFLQFAPGEELDAVAQAGGAGFQFAERDRVAVAEAVAEGRPHHREGPLLYLLREHVV